MYDYFFDERAVSFCIDGTTSLLNAYVKCCHFFLQDMSNVDMLSFGYNPDNDKDDVLLEEVKDDPSPKEKLFDFFEQDKERRFY